jgi:hypothetical protein
MKMNRFFLSDTFRKRVADAGGAAGFADTYGLDTNAIQAYVDKERRIQIGTLILITAVIDLNERPKCPLTTIDDLKKVASSLVEEKAEFEKEWDSMFA